MENNVVRLHDLVDKSRSTLSKMLVIELPK